jgi:hypothetical protein
LGDSAVLNVAMEEASSKKYHLIKCRGSGVFEAQRHQ